MNTIDKVMYVGLLAFVEHAARYGWQNVNMCNNQIWGINPTSDREGDDEELMPQDDVDNIVIDILVSRIEALEYHLDTLTGK